MGGKGRRREREGRKEGSCGGARNGNAQK